jgi:hypothetical protein
VVSGDDGMIAAIMVILSSDHDLPPRTRRKPRNFYTTKNLTKGGLSFFFPPTINSLLRNGLFVEPCKGRPCEIPTRELSARVLANYLIEFCSILQSRNKFAHSKDRYFVKHFEIQ